MTVIRKALVIMFFLFSSASFADEANLTVLYNNVPFDKELSLSWGFSCLLEGFQKTILFDTGHDGDILLNNMEKFKIDPKKIDTVVLSHLHSDHIGGLKDLLAKKGYNGEVYFPASFPDDLKDHITKLSKITVPVQRPQQICKHVWTTGELGTTIKEQSLIIETQEGLIVITGCAHPGIVSIARFAKNYFNREIFLLLGGFHLFRSGEDHIQEVISELKSLGVKKVAPSHCTGDFAIRRFRKAWGKNFIDSGCGARLSLELP